MNRFSQIGAVTVIGGLACSYATRPKIQPRTAVLPASSRIGPACQRLRPAPIPRPETSDQAAGNGLQNGRDCINPLLWVELPVYWRLIDTRTGHGRA
ncbi:MAG: hypothetical protein ACKV19_08220 [Verrucomicrobiales bacterium]